MDTTPHPMPTSLGELIAHAAIVDVITTLFVATDARDWASVRACLAPAVHFDMTSLAGGEPATLTPEQIADGWEQGLRPIEAVHHQAGNFRVRLGADGRTADAWCYAIASHYRTHPSGRNTRMFVGSYTYALRQDGERWTITSFRFDAKYVEGNLDLDKD